MPDNKLDTQRPFLAVPREEAQQRIAAQIEKAKSIPNVSINENAEAHRWYDFTTELLKQLFTTDELSDEFTGRGAFFFGYDDIRTSNYVTRLTSIYERLALYPEKISTSITGVPGLSNDDSNKSLERIISKFHIVARQLRQRHDDRVTLDVSDEYDVQDLFHALLKLYFDDIRSEEWTPSYAGSSSRMDFLLKAENIVIEAKKTRAKLGAKEIGEQLAVDIIRYRAHPDCKSLICFVYDPEERITNPRGLEKDLSKPVEEMQVEVHIVQK